MSRSDPDLVATLRRVLPAQTALPPARGARAAVAAVLRDGPAGSELLFIRRTEHPEDPWSGHIAFPGGRVDETDESALAAAVRETREEVALDLVRAAELLGRMADVPVFARGRRLPLTIEPYAFALSQTEIVLAPNEEVEEVLWVPVAELADPTRRGSFVWRREEMALTLPCFDFDGRRLWGLTLGMVDDLLAWGGLVSRVRTR